jgi:hypothetical protein
MSDSGKDGPEGQESAFRVVDRRRFAADGSERNPDAEAQASPAKEPEQEARAARPSPPPPPPPPSRSAAFEPEPEPELGLPTGDPYDDPQAFPMEPTFSTLVMSLSTQALMCLGEIPEVAGQPPLRDLAAARSVIDLLAILETKTRGNLDAGEAALLERILYDLRMRFVELSKI